MIGVLTIEPARLLIVENRAFRDPFRLRWIDRLRDAREPPERDALSVTLERGNAQFDETDRPMATTLVNVAEPNRRLR